MDAQDSLEARQEEEMRRRNLVRRAIRTISCPVCKAIPDQPCFSKSGGMRVHNHKPRKDEAEDRGLIVKRSARGRPGYTYVVKSLE